MIRLLRLVFLILALSAAAFSQAHIFPALDTNNTWTGTNSFAGSVSFNGSIFPLTPGAATVGTPSNPFGSAYIGNAATNNIQITGTATGVRVFTLPDANSNPVQPSTAGANQFATGISSAGVISYAIPSLAGLSGLLGISQTPLTTRGDLLVVGLGPVLTRLPLGGSNLYLKSNGTDTLYSTLAAGGVGSCTNQVVTTLNADAAPSCTTLALASAFFANQGSATTVLHGNAAGNPTFSGVSLTADTAANQGTVNQVLHGNAAGQPAFSGISLTSDTSANQGTVNTLLHGNAAGQPTFSAVAPADTTGTTGTGVFALQVSPSFTTPVIGAATGTSLSLSLASSSNAGTLVTGTPSFIDMSGGTGGQGGMVQSTNDASAVTGYGTWITNNAFWNGTSWIQPRGVGTASTGFTANFHKGFSFNRAAATGTNNTAFTWTEVANIDSTGLLTLGSVARTATGGPTAPAYSFVLETNSGWFRQQAGIMGFSIGGTYLTQYSTVRIGNAPGVSLGWASGAPNSFSDDVNISRISPNVLGIGTGSAGSTAGTLNLANLNASAAVNAQILNTVHNVAKYATGGAGTSVSPWTSASGTGGCQEAVNSLGTSGGNVLFTEGVYSFTNTTTGCIAADNITFDSVGRSAILQAGAINAVFFSDSTHANFARFFNLTLDGNAFTGVKGIDLTTSRFGVILQNMNFNNMNQGFVSTTGNFAAELSNVSFRAVTAPINIVANSSSLKMDYVTIDNENFLPTVACTNGINIQSGTLSNLGNFINGGFVQGCATGLLDQTVGLTVIGTYFEDNTVADISCSGAFNSHYIHTNHWGAVGPVAIKGRTCTGAKIDNPIMGSGARTGMFDWDGTNTNSVAEYIVNGSSMNTPTGTTTGLTGASLHVGTFQTTAGTKAITAYGYIGSPNFGTYLRAGELEDSIGGAAIRHLDGNGEALDGFLGFVNGQVDTILPDVWISRCAAGCLGVGNVSGVGNVGGELRAAKITVNGDTSYTNAPRITWVGFQPGNIAAATISRFTPDKSITITSIEAVSTAITACTVNPTITITGTTTSTLTLTTGAAQWTTGAIANNYTGAAQMTMIAGTTGTCTTPPVNLNIIVQYKMQ